jgi:hypothetical protein
LIPVLCLTPGSALAGVPQPLCIYYGEALDGFGWPYTTNAEVVLLHGTDEIAHQEIAGSLSPGVNFALEVHLDDGQGTQNYSPRALRSGDLVSIVVRDAYGEHTLMPEQVIPPVGAPGEIITVNVTAGNDSDLDGLPDLWEEELVYWSYGALGSILDVHPWDDFDGDGQSNGDEYRAGTFAFLSYDYFFAEDYGLTSNGRFRISFLSVPGKLYGARYVTALNQRIWAASPVAASDTAPFGTTPIEGTGDWLSIYLPGTLSSAVFHATVETLDTYELTAASYTTALVARDNAGNDPYPVSHFQLGDNGGVNFEPWIKLESETFIGSRYLAASIGDSLYSWGLSGTYAVGRALPSIAHQGLWQVRMVHDPDNTGFSGFNLKTTALPGFDSGEIIRVGMAADQAGFDGTGVYVSTDGGNSYDFLDCGWTDGRGETIVYQLVYDSPGGYTLTVVNLDEGITTQFSGSLPASAVNMIGMGVFGATLDESIQFDSLVFEAGPELSIRLENTNAVLTWLTGFTGYTLQSKSRNPSRRSTVPTRWLYR